MFVLPKNNDPKKVDLVAEIMLPDNANQKGALDTFRAHIFAFNFIPYNIDKMVESLRKNVIENSLFSTRFGLKKSAIMNNKQLGDEICYVIDRQDKEKFIGNTLEKP